MIEFRNVTLTQKKQAPLEGMCFKLKNGASYGILGEESCVRAIAELLSGAKAPTEGSVLINGFDLQREPARAKAFLGFVPASPALYDAMTPVEYLLFLADVRQIEYEQAIRRVGELLSLIGLSRKRNALIRLLSNYEKKCLTLAQALLCGTEILILSDPFSDADTQDAERFSDLLLEILPGRTVIVCATRERYLRKVCSDICKATANALNFENEPEKEEEGSV